MAGTTLGIPCPQRARLIEVQLRTVRQDAWANQVEDDGRDRGVGFKFGFGAPEVHAYCVVMAKAFEAGSRAPTERGARRASGPGFHRGPPAASPDRVSPMSVQVHHYLIVYDVASRHAEYRTFEDYEQAVAEYAKLEDQAGREQREREVVLLSADSIETIKRTHSSYFPTDGSFERLLPPGVLQPR